MSEANSLAPQGDDDAADVSATTASSGTGGAPEPAATGDVTRPVVIDGGLTDAAPATETPAPPAHPFWDVRHWSPRRIAVAGTVVVAGTALGYAASRGWIAPVMHPVDAWIKAHGAWGVGAGTGLESAMIPVPGEPAFLAVSGLAGTTHNLTQLALVIGAATAGGVVGGSASYEVGRRAGNDVARRLARNPKRERELKLGRYLFRRYGGLMVAGARFLPLVRSMSGFMAGANEMPRRQFQIANTAGTLAWAGLYGTAAYAAGELPPVAKLATLAVGAVVIGSAAVLGRKHVHALEAAAEKEFPGPLDFRKAPAGGVAPGPAQTATAPKGRGADRHIA